MEKTDWKDIRRDRGGAPWFDQPRCAWFRPARGGGQPGGDACYETAAYNWPQRWRPFIAVWMRRSTTAWRSRETGKNLGVRRRYPPVLNDARYTGPVAR
jgi:hypothetical protein